MRNNQVDRCAQPWFEKSLAPGTDTAAVATQAADAEQFWCIDWIRWSYSAAPTGGKVTVAVGGVTIDEFDVTAGGPGIMRYDPPLYVPEQTLNQAVVVTLAAAGAGITGKLLVRGR
jgi:hypothetical protein